MHHLQHTEPNWVLVNGELSHVSAFSALPPPKRPIALCPVCKDQVTLKLGNIKVHHFAHRPNATCVATHPETALHLNTKCYIYTQLLTTKSLYVQQSCVNRCGNHRNFSLIDNWQRVEIEYSFGTIRPDIAIIKNNSIHTAIEVLVTHPVDEGKAKYLSENNISWIEIRASETIYFGDKPWVAQDPLPYHRLLPAIPAWICEDCEEQQKLVRERSEYNSRNFENIISAKMIDYYFRSGKKYREVYYAVKKVQNGVWTEAWIQNEKDAILAIEKAPITGESRRRLNEAVNAKRDKLKSKGAIADEFMPWRDWQKGQRFVARDTSIFPFRYVWDDELKQWIFAQ